MRLIRSGYAAENFNFSEGLWRRTTRSSMYGRANLFVGGYAKAYRRVTSMRMIGNILIVLACAAGSLSAQTGVGAKYGARDPYACKSLKEPSSGAPSGQRLVDLVRCGSAGERVYDNQLYLLESVTVEIGKGRPYQPTDLSHKLDPSKPVYPIRGSYEKYQCDALNPKIRMKGRNPGDNCSMYPNPKATGICYSTTFGEWDCVMSDKQIGVAAATHYVAAPR
jgi:hypothetical protein